MESRFGAVFQSVLQFLRDVAAVFIPQGMFRRCPEIHGIGANLDFRRHSLFPQCRKEGITDDHMITAVTAGLCVGDVIPLLDNSHIFALAHHFNDLGNVLHKLTKDTNPRNILNFFFDSIW